MEIYLCCKGNVNYDPPREQEVFLSFGMLITGGKEDVLRNSFGLLPMISAFLWFCRNYLNIRFNTHWNTALTETM